MILPIFTLTLEPSNPLHFSVDELRSFFYKKSAEYTRLHKDSTTGFIHRYPVVQCKQIKSILMVIGIGQGADLLQEISGSAEGVPDRREHLHYIRAGSGDQEGSVRHLRQNPHL